MLDGIFYMKSSIGSNLWQTGFVGLDAFHNHVKLLHMQQCNWYNNHHKPGCYTADLLCT